MNLSWDTVQDVLPRITGDDPLQGLSLKSEIEGTGREALQTPREALQSFYTMNFQVLDKRKLRSIHVISVLCLVGHVEQV